MNIKKAYSQWSVLYDTNDNKTRDLEAFALQKSIGHLCFEQCLEMACGTGKNTLWLQSIAKEITAVDFTSEMLAIAKEKIKSPSVRFIQTDINESWDFADKKFDLITFSLVLEHIENLDAVFQKTSAALKEDAYVYIGELHPFKQYTGSKARFETSEGLTELDCFDHHISDFTQLAKKHGLSIVDLNEHFDDEDKNNVPRILTLLLKKDVIT